MTRICLAEIIIHNSYCIACSIFFKRIPIEMQVQYKYKCYLHATNVRVVVLGQSFLQDVF